MTPEQAPFSISAGLIVLMAMAGAMAVVFSVTFVRRRGKNPAVPPLDEETLQTFAVTDSLAGRHVLVVTNRRSLLFGVRWFLARRSYASRVLPGDTTTTVSSGVPGPMLAAAVLLAVLGVSLPLALALTLIALGHRSLRLRTSGRPRSGFRIGPLKRVVGSTGKSEVMWDGLLLESQTADVRELRGTPAPVPAARTSGSAGSEFGIPRLVWLVFAAALGAAVLERAIDGHATFSAPLAVGLLLGTLAFAATHGAAVATLAALAAVAVPIAVKVPWQSTESWAGLNALPALLRAAVRAVSDVGARIGPAEDGVTRITDLLPVVLGLFSVALVASLIARGATRRWAPAAAFAWPIGLGLLSPTLATDSSLWLAASLGGLVAAILQQVADTFPGVRANLLGEGEEP